MCEDSITFARFWTYWSGSKWRLFQVAPRRFFWRCWRKLPVTQALVSTTRGVSGSWSRNYELWARLKGLPAGAGPWDRNFCGISTRKLLIEYSQLPERFKSENHLQTRSRNYSNYPRNVWEKSSWGNSFIRSCYIYIQHENTDFRLSDHHDLAASSQACKEMATICSEQRIWRELACFYFTPQQIDIVITREASRDWEKIYHSLRR